MILESILGLKKCSHPNLTLDVDFAYCTDCGELVENQWFITRCSCCGMKQKAMIKNGKIIPSGKFCHNCGSNGFIIEKLIKIDFININYAVLIQKSEKTSNFKTLTQSWVESTRKNNDKPKLLPLFR